MEKLIKYKEEKLDEIVDLFLEVFENEPWDDNWPSKKKAKNYLVDIVNTPGFKGHLKFKDNKLIGVLLGHVVQWWQGDEFFIKEFFIKKSAQGAGFGSEMLNHLEASLAQNDIETILLLTEKNAPAAKFYVRKDFKVSPQTIFMHKNI